MIKKLLLGVLLSFTFSSVFSQTIVKYNPNNHTPLNKPIAMVGGKPVDVRSYYYDPFAFTYRPYNDTSEVRQYLLPNSTRGGNFPIYVKTGDSVNIWWYRNGTDDDDLVPLQLGGGSSTIDTTDIHNQLVALNNELTNKVDKVSGKQLSTNDYTTAEKTKLAGIAAGAEQNVNADWNAISGDAQILNKPPIPVQFNPIGGTGIGLSGTYPNITFNGFSGVYSDLTGKPTIPTKVSDLTNDLNFVPINDATPSSTSTYSSNKINSLISGAGGGTVLSVGLSAPTGFTVSGSPITSSGTIGLTFSSGYSLPTTAKQTSWDAKIGPSDTSVFARKTELFSKNYNDLINKPLLFDGQFSSLTGTPTTIAGYGITDAFDGQYSSLTGKPTIPENNNQLTNGSGYLNSDSLANYAIDPIAPLSLDAVNNELKIQQASASQDGYLSSTDWNTFNSKSDFDGTYASLTGKPTIPTIPAKMPIAEAQAGTANTQRTIDAATLKAAIDALAPSGGTVDAYTKTQTDSITTDTKDFVSDNYTNKNEFNTLTHDTTLVSSGTGQVRNNLNLRVNPNIVLASKPTAGDSIDYGSTKAFATESINGDGTTTTFHVTFGTVTGTPLAVIFTPASADAAKAQFYIDNLDSEGFDLIVTGTTPPSGTGNIKLTIVVY